MDELSISLIISIQLDEIDAAVQRSKGKNPEGKPADADIALATYREELLKNQVIIDDRRMGRSINEAVLTDGNIITTVELQEQGAIRDRELACRVGGIEAPNLTGSSALNNEEVSHGLNLDLTTENSSVAGSYDDLESTDGGSSSKIFTTAQKQQETKVQCVACQEYKPKIATMAVRCTHVYCRDCILALFEASITDESLFPPRCCRQLLTLASVATFLTPTLIGRFEARAVELKLPDRMYCIQPTCSAFIPPETIAGDIAVCPECSQTMCTICKNASHEGDCPEDTVLQTVLSTATANRWQRCYACKRLVELTVGCNHMTYVGCLISLAFSV